MKKFIWAILASFAILNCASAHADSITGVITGDDNISYWNGSNWVAASTSWQAPATINFNINHTSDEAYFAVVNNSWGNPNAGGNPAGFLASFTDNSGSFSLTNSNTLVSNSAIWQVLAAPQWTASTGPFATPSDINPSADPSTLSGWTAPTTYATNGTGIWGSVNGGPLNGIDPNAQWIWSANDTSWTYAGTDDYDYFKVDLGVTDPGPNRGNQGVPTPEPPTFLLFAFAGALIFFFNKNKIAIGLRK